MTECTQTSSEFEGHFSKQVVARFDGGRQTSDAGGLLLRETDRASEVVYPDLLRVSSMDEESNLSSAISIRHFV